MGCVTLTAVVLGLCEVDGHFAWSCKENATGSVAYNIKSISPRTEGIELISVAVLQGDYKICESLLWQV